MLVVRGEGGHHRMALRVVTDHVPVADLANGRFAEIAQHLADHEEGPADVQALEDAEYLWGVGAGTVVKGKGDVASAAASLFDEWGECQYRAHGAVFGGFDLSRR